MVKHILVGFLCLSIVLASSDAIAQTMAKDTQQLWLMLEQEQYEDVISFAEKRYDKYMSKGDSISAYWMVTLKLESLSRNKKDVEFLKISDPLLAELNPIKFLDIVREIRLRRYYFYYYRMDKKYVEETNAIRNLEKKYGTPEGYVEATLSYISTNIYNKDKLGKIKLLEEIENITRDSSKLFRIYSMMANAYINVNSSKAEHFFEEAYNYIKKEKKVETCASFHREYSRFLMSQGSYSKCISEGLESVKIYDSNERFNFPKMDMYRVISRAFLNMNQYDRAREYIDKSIKIADDNKYKFRSNVAKDNGNLLFIEGKYDQAISEMRNSADYYIEKKLIGSAVHAFSKLGSMYLDLGKIDAADEVNLEIKDFRQKFKVSHKDDYSLAEFRSQLAYIKGDNTAALKELHAIIDQKKDNVDIHTKEKAYSRLAVIYSKKNDYKNGLKYTQLHQEIKDSLTAVTTTQIAMQMESEFNRKGQNNKIDILDQENRIQELSLANQKNLIILGSVILLALGLFSFILLRLFRKVKSQNLIIVRALEEKDILLKEIHHRVKNNLQLVSSLLTLQSREVKDEKALEALAAGKSRVRSMALIHQDLYSKENLTGIGMKKYLENLSEELFDAYKIDENQITLHMDVEDISLDVDTIIPLGLIINELITNALKYAFEGRQKGRLEISFYQKGEKLYLDVNDDGIGMNDTTFDKSGSFGNKLVNTLTRQLNGKLNISTNHGTQIQVEIKDYKLAS